MFTEVDQLEIVDRGILRDVGGGMGAHDLAAMRDGHQARRSIEHGTEVVVVTALGFASVDPDAHLERTGRIPRLGLHRPLYGDGGPQRFANSTEHGEAPISAALHDLTPVGLDGAPHDRVVTSQGVLHPIGVLLPQAG